MTTIEKLKNIRSKGKSAHYNRLLKGLDNEPYNYFWTGTVIDLAHPVGSCVCGHAIRYEFVLEHKLTGKIVKVGSVCVETFQVFDKATTDGILNKMKEIKAELRAKKAEAKKLIQKKEIRKLLSIRKPFLDWVIALRKLYNEADTFVPHDLYSYKSANPKKYVRLTSCIKALEKDIEILKKLRNNHKSDIIDKLNKIIESNIQAQLAQEKYDKKEAKRIANLKHIGTVGERHNFTVILKSSWLNRNYNTMFYKFQDANGNIIIKWGILTTIDFIDGNTYAFNAEIKKHGEYNNEKSTTITKLKNIVEVNQ